MRGVQHAVHTSGGTVLTGRGKPLLGLPTIEDQRPARGRPANLSTRVNALSQSRIQQHLQDQRIGSKHTSARRCLRRLEELTTCSGGKGNPPVLPRAEVTRALAPSSKRPAARARYAELDRVVQGPHHGPPSDRCASPRGRRPSAKPSRT